MEIGVISDIHGNLPALERVLEVFEQRNVKTIICCGDIIGYGPYPNECAALVKNQKMIAVRGNHDTRITDDSELDEFSAHARRAALWTRDQLSPEIKEFLMRLPLPGHLDALEITHASFRDPLWEYIIDRRVAYYNFQACGAAVAFFGHSHIPTVFRWNEGDVLGGRVVEDFELIVAASERYLFNPGSVGQPRDGDWRASCALVSQEKYPWKIEFLRIEYPVEETRKAMQRAGLPAPLYDRLLVGA
jgi:putative phosphoesterase